MNQPAANSMSQPGTSLSNFNVVLIWFLLTSSTVIYFLARIEETKFGINLSPFDVIVLVIFGICLTTKKVKRPLRSVWMATTALLVLFTAHTMVLYYNFDPSPVLLAKGFVKLTASITLTALLVVLFRTEELRSPPFPSIIAVFIATSIYLVILSGIIAFSNTNFVPLTSLLSALFGMIFLLVLNAYHHPQNTRRLFAGAAALLATTISILLQSKGFTLVGIGFLVVIIFAWNDGRLEKYIQGWRLLAVLGYIAVIGTVIVVGLQQFELLPASTDTILRSISIRGILWKHAIEVGSVSFPWGIGGGQFSVSVSEACQPGRLSSAVLTLDCPTMIIEEHEVAHSTALTWFAEFGILGLILVFGVIGLILKSAMSWPAGLRLMFLIYLSVPLILHDGHGLRMVMLILALGIANAIYPSKYPSQEIN